MGYGLHHRILAPLGKTTMTLASTSSVSSCGHSSLWHTGLSARDGARLVQQPLFHQDSYWLPVLFATSARSSSVCYGSSQLTLALHANAKRKVCLALAIEAYIARIDCPEYPAQRSRPSTPSSTISILGFVSLSLDASRHNSGSGANWMDK